MYQVSGKSFSSINVAVRINRQYGLGLASWASSFSSVNVNVFNYIAVAYYVGVFYSLPVRKSNCSNWQVKRISKQILELSRSTTM